MIRIVSDSSALYSKKDGQAKGVTIAPLIVTINGKTYREYEDINTEEFINIINEGHIPVSSQPAIGEVLNIYDENIEKFCQNLRKNPLYALTIWSSTVDTEPAVRHSTGSIWAGVHRVLKGSCQRSHRLPGRCFQRYSCRRSIYGQRQWKR